MADVSKINLYGTEYSIKDNTARTAADEANTSAENAQNTANGANETAKNNSIKITKLSAESVVISYESADESITVTKGIALS